MMTQEQLIAAVKEYKARTSNETNGRRPTIEVPPTDGAARLLANGSTGASHWDERSGWRK